MSYINTLWIYILFAAMAAIVLIVGLYVYRDAKARRMRAGIWTMIAVLMPCFIGLLMYVLMRDDDKNLRCVACGYPIKSDWKVCPVCETPLPKSPPMTSATLRNDKGIWKVTAVVIVIPICICILIGAVMMPRINNHYLGGMTSYDMTMDDVKNEDLQKWFRECEAKNDDTRCYVLLRSRAGGEDSDEKETNYVIYIKGKDRLKFVDAQTSADQYTLILETKEGQNENGYVIMGTAYYIGTLKLLISIDGTTFEPAYSDADFDLERIVNDTLDD